MTELTSHQERILIECLQALDEGVTLADCLARYPNDAAALRPYLDLRARLRPAGVVEPSAAAYAAGRQALLEQVAAAPVKSAPVDFSAGVRWRSVAESVRGILFGGGARWQPAFARVAAVMAVVVVVGGGALGASAAGGFEPARRALSPARDVLEALHIVDERTEEPAPPDAADDGPVGRDGDTPVVDDGDGDAADDAPGVAPCRTDDRDTSCADRVDDEPRPTQTPTRDALPTETHRDLQPTEPRRATVTPTEPLRSDEPVRDEPNSPDPRPTERSHTDVQPIDPGDVVEPTATEEFHRDDVQPAPRPVDRPEQDAAPTR